VKLRVLDQKINMFDLVVGEVGAFLGEFDNEVDFSPPVSDALLKGIKAALNAAFAALELMPT